MTCWYPLEGFIAPGLSKNGKRNIVFNKNRAYSDLQSIPLPCGQCSGCRFERSRQWAMRCVHESQLHERNCFITLTFEDTYLPDNYSIDIKDLQLFFKKLRKKYVPVAPKGLSKEDKQVFMDKHGIRYFACAEYGDLNRRPHYHAILFNHDFKDKIPYKKSPRGDIWYISEELSKLWPFGYVLIGAMTFESAAYVARYAMKKITGDLAKEHYTVVHPLTGEVVESNPEFVTMSRRPGIATGWYRQFYRDVYPSDMVIMRGKKMMPPKFYDKLFELDHPLEYDIIKKSRLAKAKLNADNNTPDRLAVRQECFEAKFKSSYSDSRVL